MSFPQSAGAGGELSPGGHPVLLLSALTCSECNVCESVACPVGISPMRINRLLKRELRAKNLRYDGPLRPRTRWRSTAWCRSSGSSATGLDPWYQEAPLTAVEPEVACVTLPLRPAYRHQRRALRRAGRAGNARPATGGYPRRRPRAPVHASIDGLVSAITEQAITLVRG
ncbi:cob(III)alamin/Cob(II)alamin reductase [Klebsiella pneumoniae]|uniref:Cob(III)alamin/Cob(II)alamin reductase n=1 Tax=Klebsiella pneumoniae TaxID=573 RepID=A0A2X1SE81_KLEPN|nr:cob(III)alamin/Cob(II)alamin reductase [Klebsiella pneumoniae]